MSQKLLLFYKNILILFSIKQIKNISDTILLLTNQLIIILMPQINHH